MTPNRAANSGSDEPTGTRRAYRAPQLRQLGSVRELTLGKSGQIKEGLFGKMTMQM